MPDARTASNTGEAVGAFSDAGDVVANGNSLPNSIRNGGRILAGGGTGGGEDGVVLPGPEGGVEVRELNGGMLVVRRTADEKKRTPERLNLHRRQLKSCPVIQVLLHVFVVMSADAPLSWSLRCVF